MVMKQLTEKDTNIINVFNNKNNKKEILNVGCGQCRIDYHLINMGYTVYSTDIYRDKILDNPELTKINFSICDIFDISTYPKKEFDTIICSQVLEHLPNYEEALKNLYKLTKNQLIITIPWKKSFHDPSHVNFWDDTELNEFKSIKEFGNILNKDIKIEKIYTKQRDRQTGSMNYLINIEK